MADQDGVYRGAAFGGGVIRLRLFARGFIYVALTAWNVRHIAALNYGAALLGAFAISSIWWGNAAGASMVKARGARECYALGAALGTVCGMWLAR